MKHQLRLGGNMRKTFLSVMLVSSIAMTAGAAFANGIPIPSPNFAAPISVSTTTLGVVKQCECSCKYRVKGLATKVNLSQIAPPGNNTIYPFLEISDVDACDAKVGGTCDGYYSGEELPVKGNFSDCNLQDPTS
jgi:hypothetical protein